MHISYRYGIEHPVGKGFLFFWLAVVSAFGFINIMNVGMYGYTMSMQSMWFMFVGVAFLGFDAKYGKAEHGWEVIYRWFGIKLFKTEFEELRLVEDGKLFRIEGLVKGEFRPISIAFNEKQANFFKMIFNK